MNTALNVSIWNYVLFLLKLVAHILVNDTSKSDWAVNCVSGKIFYKNSSWNAVINVCLLIHTPKLCDATHLTESHMWAWCELDPRVCWGRSVWDKAQSGNNTILPGHVFFFFGKTTKKDYLKLKMNSCLFSYDWMKSDSGSCNKTCSHKSFIHDILKFSMYFSFQSEIFC